MEVEEELKKWRRWYNNKKYEANLWAEKIEDLLINNTKIHQIKELKNDNSQKSLKDIFFSIFKIGKS